MIAPPSQAADMIDITGAIELAGIVGIHQSGTETGAFGMLVRRRQQAFQPVRLRKGIGIEQRQPFHLARPLHRQVVGGGETQVAIRADALHLGVFGLQSIGGTVTAGVVHHDHLLRAPGLATEVTQAFPKQRSTVEIDDDHRHSGQHIRSTPIAGLASVVVAPVSRRTTMP